MYCIKFLVYEGSEPVKKSCDVHIIPFLLRMRLFTESTWLFQYVNNYFKYYKHYP